MMVVGAFMRVSDARRINSPGDRVIIGPYSSRFLLKAINFKPHYFYIPCSLFCFLRSSFSHLLRMSCIIRIMCFDSLFRKMWRDLQVRALLSGVFAFGLAFGATNGVHKSWLSLTFFLILLIRFREKIASFTISLYKKKMECG